jgi:hypothetical protein
MTDEKPEALPQFIVDEAWSKFVYPRAAIGELSLPPEQGAFMRAARVFRQWAREHDTFWSGLVDLTERKGHERAAAELESLADEMELSPAHMPVTAEDVRARAAQLREKAGAK